MRERQRRYEQTAKGRATRKRYKQSLRGVATRNRARLQTLNREMERLTGESE